MADLSGQQKTTNRSLIQGEACKYSQYLQPAASLSIFCLPESTTLGNGFRQNAIRRFPPLSFPFR